jgi:hypothetical protein
MDEVWFTAAFIQRMENNKTMKEGQRKEWFKRKKGVYQVMS